jgi:hypothetical protein
MTPDERARALFRDIIDAAMSSYNIQERVDILADGIRHAENGALDRAARMADDWYDMPQIADAIRALKHTMNEP